MANANAYIPSPDKIETTTKGYWVSVDRSYENYIYSA